MRYPLLLLVCIFCYSVSYSAINKKVTLKRAMFMKTISVKSISNGGIDDKSLHLDLVNNTDTELTITIEPGLIFVPDDTTYQNQVIRGDEVITLAPCSRRSMDMAAYCGKSYAHCPRPNLNYKFWRQGDSNMIKVMRYAKENGIGRGLLQRAVWIFTNNHAISTVYDDYDPVVSEKFLRYIAAVKKCPVPAFHMKYAISNRPGQEMVSRDHKVYLTMHWGHEGYRQMYLDIFKENGTLYKRIEADRIIDKNGYTVQVEMDPQRDPKGTYIVKLHDNSNKIWDEKKVIVGIDPHDVPAQGY